MRKLVIEWTEESTDCDQAGCSGGWGRGAVAKLDGVVIFERECVASCTNSSWVDSEEVLVRALRHLGVEVDGLDVDYA